MFMYVYTLFELYHKWQTQFRYSYLYIMGIFFSICGVVYIKLIHSCLGDRDDKNMTHFILIKSAVSIFPIFVFFPWPCAWAGCTAICCRFHIYLGNTGFSVFYHCAVLWYVQIIDYIVIWWSYSFVCTYHYLIIVVHYADLSEDIELLKCLSYTFCPECVSKIKSILSTIFHATYATVRFQLQHFCYGKTMVRQWANGLRCVSLYSYGKDSFDRKPVEPKHYAVANFKHR